MTLHIPTLFVALFLAFALLALALGFAQRVLANGAGFSHWTWGVWALVAGFTALASRAALPEWFAVLAGNGLVILSLLQFSRALHRFIDDSEAPRWKFGLAAAAMGVVAAVLSWPLHQRTSVVSVLMAAQLAPSVWLVARRGWRRERSLRTVGLAFGVTVIALLLRAGHAWSHPAEYSGFFQASLGNGLTYLMAFLFPLGAGFGFLLASLERAARHMEELATHDSLTGCVNRAHFDTLLAHEWRRAQREGSALSLALIDLDHFKRINDEHGHRTGDDVLRAFAAAVRTRLRTSDIFGRVGGEEFGVVLPAADAAGATRLAEEVRAAVAALQLHSRRGVLVSVTASVGVCTVRGDPLLTEDEFFARADRALYAVKRRGRDGVAHSDEVPALQAG